MKIMTSLRAVCELNLPPIRWCVDSQWWWRVCSGGELTWNETKSPVVHWADNTIQQKIAIQRISVNKTYYSSDRDLSDSVIHHSYNWDLNNFFQLVHFKFCEYSCGPLQNNIVNLPILAQPYGKFCNSTLAAPWNCELVPPGLVSSSGHSRNS